MDIRFNGGRGALLCERCLKVVMEDFEKSDWAALTEMRNQQKTWICAECDPSVQMQQVDSLAEALFWVLPPRRFERVPEWNPPDIP